MEEDVNISEIEYNFIGILENMHHLTYYQTAELIRIEEQIYAEISKCPENLVGLVVLLQNQIMQGNLPKATGLAHKIWSIGGDISETIEVIYINCLLSLGLLDMASVLIKPRLEKITENIENFSGVLIKFSIQTGNIALLEKIISYQDSNQKFLFENFIFSYQQMNYTQHFKNIQKIVLESVKENLLSYEYNLYFDRAFTDVEAVIYVDLDRFAAQSREEEIDRKIDAYCLSAQIKRINNYQVIVKNIAEHPAFYPTSEVPRPEDNEDNLAKQWGL